MMDWCRSVATDEEEVEQKVSSESDSSLFDTVAFFVAMLAMIWIWLWLGQ